MKMKEKEVIKKIILVCNNKNYDTYSIPPTNESFDSWLAEKRYYPYIFSKELADVLGYTLVDLALWVHEGGHPLGFIDHHLQSKGSVRGFSVLEGEF